MMNRMNWHRLGYSRQPNRPFPAGLRRFPRNVAETSGCRANKEWTCSWRELAHSAKRLLFAFAVAARVLEQRHDRPRAIRLAHLRCRLDHRGREAARLCIATMARNGRADRNGIELGSRSFDF